MKKAAVSLPSSELDEARPFVLMAMVRNVQQLTAVNEAARDEGLSPGMTLTHARALMPDIVTRPANPEADRIGLEKLADWCGRYSPLSGVDDFGDDGIWIDVSGCAHLFGGEEAMLDDLRHRLTNLGLHHRLGLAETKGAAWAIARYSPARSVECRQIIKPGDLGGSLADLPVAGLRLLPEVVTLLRRLGLKQIGQLNSLPRAALGKRFSSKEMGEAVLLRLDQAFARQDEPMCPRYPLPVHRAERGFLEPIIDLPPLVHGLECLAFDLCRMLDKAEQGAVRLTLLAYRVDGDVKVLKIGASQPTRDQQHIERLFTERLETIDAGFGIEYLALHANRVEILGPKQASLGGGITENADQDERLAQLIDRLANRFGPDAMTVSVPFESHLPERAARHISAMKGHAAPADTHVKATGPPRPSCLLLKPEPIKAMAEVPDGPPLRFTWRRVTRRIIRAEGPERIAPEWWTDAVCEVGTADRGNKVGVAGSNPLVTLIRDYYRVEDEQGQRYWLFRAGLYDNAEHPVNATSRAGVSWFIHGLFG